MTRWIAPALLAVAGLCVVAALVVSGDAALYLIGVSVAAAFGALVAAYIWR